MNILHRLYEKMFLIRRFEESLEVLFEQGLLHGTIHGYIGQEAIAVAISEVLQEEDIVVGNHRSHGHFLSRTDNVDGLLTELMGRATGIVGGRGGSQHLYAKNFFSNGVIGSMTPVAVGMGLACKAKGNKNIVVCFIGDGSLGQGVLYEAMNMASLWKVPILFVLENNMYAMSTPVSRSIAGGMMERAKAFDIATETVIADDVQQLVEQAKGIVEKVRTAGPFFWVINTYRFCGHSKSDKCGYRTKEEEDEWHKKDPLAKLAQILPQDQVQEIQARCELRMAQSIKHASEAPWPSEANMSIGAVDPIKI